MPHLPKACPRTHLQLAATVVTVKLSLQAALDHVHQVRVAQGVKPDVVVGVNDGLHLCDEGQVAAAGGRNARSQTWSFALVLDELIVTFTGLLMAGWNRTNCCQA
jgi:hypothetical protein